MKIEIEFLNGSTYWKQLVKRNAEHAGRVLSDPAFLAKVENWTKFDFTSDTPRTVATRLEKAGTVKIRVGFYTGWWWSKAIAYEDGGAIYFNTRKEAYGAGGVGNIAHEFMHALGYSHNGNSPAGQENTVPWRVGQWAEGWALSTQGCAQSVPVSVL